MGSLPSCLDEPIGVQQERMTWAQAHPARADTAFGFAPISILVLERTSCGNATRLRGDGT
jgi:hypothetical protein